MAMPSHDDIRKLPLPDLSLRLLGSLSRENANFNNLIQGFKQAGGYGAQQPSDLGALLARLSDAWSWLEAHALIGPSAENPSSSWQRLTAVGAEVVDDPSSFKRFDIDNASRQT